MSEAHASTAALLAACAAGAFALSAALTRVAMRCCARWGFVDRPGGAGSHKAHARIVPYGGGSAIFASLALCVVAGLMIAWLWPGGLATTPLAERLAAYAGGLRERTPQLLAIFAAALGLHALGLIDDLRAQGPRVKLAVILAAAVLASTLGEVRIARFAGDAGSLALSVLWIGVITNSFNFLDNMDGLSGGVAAVCALFLALCGAMAGQVHVPALGALLLGSLCGFLLFNLPPARIFMGDAGSLVIGFLVAVLSAQTTYYAAADGGPPYALAMPLVLLAVPLYDFCTVVVIRLREGRSPFRGDRRHFSHRLVEHGLSTGMAVATICLATAATGLLATLLPGAGARETLTVLLVTVLVLSTIAILESPPRRQP